LPFAATLHEDMPLESANPIEGGRRDWRRAPARHDAFGIEGGAG